MRSGVEGCYICVFLEKKSNLFFVEIVRGVDLSWCYDLEGYEVLLKVVD